MSKERIRHHRVRTKGFITTFKEHPHLEPYYTHKFNYFGSKWNSVNEAYEGLEEPEMSTQKKLNLMGKILYACFSQNSDAAAELLTTKDIWIEKKVTTHDNFWHNCKCPECYLTEGNNYYGRLLMEVRHRLLWEKSPNNKYKKTWKPKYF